MPSIQRNCIACNAALLAPQICTTGILCKPCASQGLFRKRLAITGITRMNRGHICVSGIDLQTNRFVRPVYATGLERDFVMSGNIQIIRHFNVVELELREYVPSAIHHTEDWVINERFAPRYVGHLTDQQMLRLLDGVAVRSLDQAMGERDRSLFVVKGVRLTHLWHEESYGKFRVRVTFFDGGGTLHTRVPVTDLLVLAKVRWLVSQGINYSIQILNGFNGNAFRYIRVGLTRQFHGTYWKQVTGLVTIPDMFNGESFSEYEKRLGEAA